VAYLSRSFGPVGDDEQKRLASGDPLPAGAAVPGGAPSGLQQAAVPGAPESANVDHNAIRSFFDANKDQGANVLGGLADSLSQRIQAAPGQMQAVPGITPIYNSGFKNDIRYTSPTGNAPATRQDMGPAVAASKEANAASILAAKEAAANNVASLSPLKTDVGQLGSMEGQQNLLSQRAAGQNYTPGQGRLDSWLSGAAANQSPGTLNNVNAGMQALTDNAGIYDPSTQQRKNMEDYLNGR
jgi:hypothetical protein